MPLSFAKFMRFGCLAVVFLLGACSSYHVRDGSGVGYSELPLREDTYKVSFGGGSSDTLDDVRTHFLHRCAELAVQIGKPYFTIEEADDQRYFHDDGSQTFSDTDVVGQAHTNAYGMFGPHSALANASTFGHAHGTTHTTTFNNQYHTYERSGVVHFYTKAQKPDKAYDAQLILRQFAPKEE